MEISFQIRTPYLIIWTRSNDDKKKTEIKKKRIERNLKKICSPSFATSCIANEITRFERSVSSDPPIMAEGKLTTVETGGGVINGTMVGKNG